MSDEKPRLVIAYDGDRWYVRRVYSITRDGVHGHMVYRCDEPISNDHATLDEAAESAREWLHTQLDAAELTADK